MNDSNYSARRAVASTVRQAETSRDLTVRFRTLVQSPLRASILRHLHANPEDSFELESLMQVVGRMRLDVENCARELVSFGVARLAEVDSTRYGALRPADEQVAEMLDDFLDRRATVTTEDQSPAVQRFREMIGRDEKMLVVFEWIRTAAKSDISVLILGATGSGKEVVARMIHELSRRRTGRFQAVNCAALPDTLFESELFGHEKGAFTGAHDRKPGRLELADKGTLFLDEIGDLSVMAQAKLLRVLEDRRFERLGGNRAIEVDFRLISATNRPLDLFVRDARFREDLYYRVNAFAIRVPSLRERQIDIPLLAQRFLARYCAGNGLAPDGKSFTKEAFDALTIYPWPGNIRELESTVSRAALSAPGRAIRATDIEFLNAVAPITPADDQRLPTLAQAERAHILRILDAVNWNKKQAAEVLEISRGTLYRKIAEYKLGTSSSAPHVPQVSKNGTLEGVQ
jgi:DNA-binding NtrC family response regulator